MGKKNSKLPKSAPRNGHVASMMTRGGGGAHQKTVKAIRRADRISLAKAMRDTSPAMAVIVADVSSTLDREFRSGRI